MFKLDWVAYDGDGTEALSCAEAGALELGLIKPESLKTDTERLMFSVVVEAPTGTNPDDIESVIKRQLT